MRHFIVKIQFTDNSISDTWYVVNTKSVHNLVGIVAKRMRVEDVNGNYVIPDNIALLITDITEDLRNGSIVENHDMSRKVAYDKGDNSTW